MFSSANVPIRVRTRKISQIKFVFDVYSGGNQPASLSMEKRSHRYLEDFGRDAPAICPSQEGCFHKFNFDTVLPASKTTAGIDTI